MIAVARALGLSITAEGVETEEQFNWLARAGCDHVQGFLTGYPMSATEFEAAFIRLATVDGARMRSVVGGEARRR